MILQIVHTYVDDNTADVDLWDVDVTAQELAIIEEIAKNGLPDPAEGEELLVFRGREYTAEDDLDTLLAVVGKPIKADQIINVYVY